MHRLRRLLHRLARLRVGQQGGHRRAGGRSRLGRRRVRIAIRPARSASARAWSNIDNGDCVFFDNKTRKCRVYAARPRQCRTWPFWDSNIRTPEAWAETCQVCPGSGKGRLYQLEEIQRAGGGDSDLERASGRLPSLRNCR